MDRPYDKLLVLDLDETLIHTVAPFGCRELKHKPHFGIFGGYVVYRRPGVQEFLDECFQKFREVALWTAGTRPYAFEVLPHLCDTSNFSFVWGREKCTWHRVFDMDSTHNSDTWTHGHWLKDIRKLKRKGYAQEQILFVDDSPHNFKRSYGNYVPIRKFLGDPEDRELERLSRYLDTLGPVPNVRTVEKRHWQAMSQP